MEKIWKKYQRYGIALYAFEGTTEHQITVSLGESLHIKQFYPGWYLVTSIDTYRSGIIPANFVKVVSKTIPTKKKIEQLQFREVIQIDPFIREMNETVQFWGTKLKEFHRDKVFLDFEFLKSNIKQLLSLKKTLENPQSSLDSKLQAREKTTKLFDIGTKFLKLPRPPRTSKFIRADENNSTIFQLANSYSLMDGGDKKTQGSGSKSRPNLLKLTFNDISIDVGDSCLDVEIFLYDSGQGCSVSETFLIPLSDTFALRKSEAKLSTFFEISNKNIFNLYLVCRVVRLGELLLKKKKSKGIETRVRRPWACGIFPINLKLLNSLLNPKQLSFKLYNCQEQLFPQIEQLIINKDQRVLPIPKSTINITFLNRIGSSLEIKNNDPNYFEGYGITQKIHKDDIILPSSNRNDLYFTLLKGEFSTGQLKNVEVRIQVRDNKKGNPIKSSISLGDGNNPTDEYEAIIYHHQTLPIWNERIKINLSPQDMKKSHLYFEIGNISDDSKNRKTYLFGWKDFVSDQKYLNKGEISLDLFKYSSGKQGSYYLNQKKNTKNKTELKLTKNKLTLNIEICSSYLPNIESVYRILEWRRTLGKEKDKKEKKTAIKSLINNLDANEDLLLYITPLIDALICMIGLKEKTYGNEIFKKFLKIFAKLNTQTNKDYIKVIDDYIKYKFTKQNIKKNSPLKKGITKLPFSFISNLIFYCDNAAVKEHSQDSRTTLKLMNFFFKFIIGSINALKKIQKNKNFQNTKNQFSTAIIELFQSISKLMTQLTPESILAAQTYVIKNFYSCLIQTTQTIDLQLVSKFSQDFFESVSTGRESLVKDKYKLLESIINGPLLKVSAARKHFLPIVINLLMNEITNNENNFKQGIKLLNGIYSSVMNHNENIPGFEQLKKIKYELPYNHEILELLRFPELVVNCWKYNQNLQNEKEEMKQDSTSKSTKTQINPDLLKGEKSFYMNTKTDLLSIILSFFHSMGPSSFHSFLNKFSSSHERRGKLLYEILSIVHENTSQTLYPKTWGFFKLIKLSIIPKILRIYFSILIKEFNGIKFHQQLWIKFIALIVEFIRAVPIAVTLAAASQEDSTSGKIKIIERFGNMHLEAANILERTWNSLGNSRVKLIHQSVIESFLNLMTQKDQFLVNLGFKLYYNVLELEFESTKLLKQSEAITIVVLERALHKGSWEKLEKIFFGGLFNKLKSLETTSSTTTETQKTTTINKIKKATTLKEQGLKFIEDIRIITERLKGLQIYIETKEFEEERSQLILNLLAYFIEEKQYNLLLRYIHSLWSYNLSLNNFTEAGNSILMSTKYLTWNTTQILESNGIYPRQTESKRKENILTMALEAFEKGKNWELMIPILRELRGYYENKEYDYKKVCSTLRKETEIFESISTKARGFPTYFRVAYFGKGFDTERYRNLINQDFIYKGELLEQLSVFMGKLKQKFPKAKLASNPPTEEELKENEMYIQVANVTPSSMEVLEKNERTDITINMPQFRKDFVLNNNISVFLYSKPFRKKKKDKNKKEDEFRELWLRNEFLITENAYPYVHKRSRVIRKETVEVSPISNAINSVKEKNRDLKNKIDYYEEMKGQVQNVNPLTMALNGIIDAAVNGGIGLYCDAFFHPSFVEENPDERHKVQLLKFELKKQQQLLKVGLVLHEEVVSKEMRGLHNKLKKMFKTLKRLISPFVN
ncbi:dedicator of cytokinesis [Anaeramoeba flamelloides]|uniref:Dedicator of cytokinesis n=1 Tax=Anaeramoeba flamelloides TaxID=1746091 RepID=A0ABQ8YCM4_9EUKA|nr:dedicator of cytokinesis [Anaeramoeba flamelloides]